MFRRSMVLNLALIAILGSSGSLLSACSSPKPTGLAIPDKFPINCYPGSECTQSDSTPVYAGKYRQIVVLKTKDDFDKALQYYKTEVVSKGYRLLSDNNRRGIVTLECISDEAKLVIILVPVAAETVISISYDPKIPATK